MKHTFKTALLCIFLFGSKALWAQDKTLEYTDKVYEEGIESVQLYPGSGIEGQRAQPIVPLGSSSSLMLHFDQMADDPEDFDVRIIHCNSNWQPSDFKNIDLLNDYNNFDINDFETSLNTRVKYVHYRFRLPQVKVSGNFIVLVYREGDEEDIVLSKRFMVYENICPISLLVQRVNDNTASLTHQQVQCTSNYAKLNLINPQQNVKLFLRQNYRWDNCITNIKPLYVREMNKQLDFGYSFMETAFEAGNEFRYFDASSFYARGWNVKQTNATLTPVRYTLVQEKSRNDLSYNFIYQDLNGRYYIDNKDLPEDDIKADYVDVLFSLKADISLDIESIYVRGAFSNWELQERYKMSLNETSGLFELLAQFKMGVYNYEYVAVMPNGKVSSTLIDGSHFVTKNEYDAFLYYLEPAGKGERLIGYASAASGFQ